VTQRISELIKRKQRDRIRKHAAMEKKMAGGIKNAKGEFLGPVPQPTLPDVRLDDDDYSTRKKAGTPSMHSNGRKVGVRSPGEEYADYGLGYPPGGEYRAPYGGKGVVYAEEYGRSVLTL
jgi:hypothetical protein